MDKVLLTHAIKQYTAHILGGGDDENNLKLNKNKQKTDGWEKKKLHAESKPSDHQM